MCDEKIAVRVLLRHYWKKGFSSRAATKEICDVEGEDYVSKSAAGRWFKRFQDGDIDLEDKPRSGRPPEIDDDVLLATLQEDTHASSRDMSVTLDCHHSTVCEHLRKLGFSKRKFRQVPHELTAEQAKRRIEVCKQLLENPLDERFFKRIVTCDEKWIYFRNHDTRRQWALSGQAVEPVAKRGRFEPKVMMCVWWNYHGVIHYELVPNGRAVNADLYSEQLERVHQAIRQLYPALVNRGRVLLQHDNARPHVSRRVREKIEELGGIEVLPHPAYSPDLAPSDYYLFRSMAHFLRGRTFETPEDVENGCREFFDSKPREWYKRGIEELAQRWMSVIEHNGLYFKD